MGVTDSACAISLLRSLWQLWQRIVPEPRLSLSRTAGVSYLSGAFLLPSEKRYRDGKTVSRDEG